MLNLGKVVISTIKFLRIVDENNQLSITNIGVFVVLYKLAMTQSTSISDVGALFIGLSHYSYKKYLNKDSVNSAAQLANQIITKSEELSS